MGLFPTGDINELIAKTVKQYVSDPAVQKKVLEEVKKHVGKSDSPVSPLAIIEMIEKAIGKK